jgi:hypothetical protein
VIVLAAVIVAHFLRSRSKRAGAPRTQGERSSERI